MQRSYLSLGDRVTGDEKLRENVVQVPFEGFAVQFLSQRLALRYVTKITLKAQFPTWDKWDNIKDSLIQ